MMAASEEQGKTRKRKDIVEILNAYDVCQVSLPSVTHPRGKCIATWSTAPMKACLEQ
jgi:predicted AlkP superfamily pyrophosphatase or phosphodiesterase